MLEPSRVFRTLSSTEAGASLTGYGLVVGLIAIVALGAVTTTGQQVNNLFGNVSDSLDAVDGGSSVSSGPASPPDAAPPSIAAGQSFDMSAWAIQDAVIGTVSASDDIGITGLTITAGDPGGSTPYLQISPTGEISVTAAGEDALSAGSHTVTIQASDAAGNTVTEDISLTIDSHYHCATTDSVWAQPVYADVVGGGTWHLCYAARSIDVFSIGIGAVTSCPSPADIVGHFKLSSNPSTNVGAVRFETAYTNASSSNSASWQHYNCTNADCTTVSAGSTGGTSPRTIAINPTLCSISTDGYNASGGSVIGYQQFGTSGTIRHDVFMYGMTGTSSSSYSGFNPYVYSIYRDFGVASLSAVENVGAVNGYYYLEYRP
ncbi:MAG: hypothetical protein Alpg2KO_09020 [Alphaproteobacteria bacterium]